MQQLLLHIFSSGARLTFVFCDPSFDMSSHMLYLLVVALFENTSTHIGFSECFRLRHLLRPVVPWLGWPIVASYTETGARALAATAVPQRLSLVIGDIVQVVQLPEVLSGLSQLAFHAIAVVGAVSICMIFGKACPALQTFLSLSGHVRFKMRHSNSWLLCLGSMVCRSQGLSCAVRLRQI